MLMGIAHHYLGESEEGEEDAGIPKEVEATLVYSRAKLQQLLDDARMTGKPVKLYRADNRSFVNAETALKILGK